MMELPEPDQKFVTAIGEFEIVKLLGKGKSAYSFLAIGSNQKFVLKIMHNEPNPYYQFEQNKIDAEKAAYNTLNEIQMPVPKLIYYNKEKNFLIKEFIDGKTAAETIALNLIDDKIFEQLFEISKKLSRYKINIDYFPTNFVIRENRLFYIDYEINSYDEKWNLENWGIYYWVNSEGFKKFLQTNDASFINEDVGSGIPIKEPYRHKVKSILEKFG